MTNEQLKRANKLKSEIRQLENFIDTASSVWGGKLIHQTQKFLFKSMPYGVLESKEYFMGREMKNKVLGVLKQHLEEIKEELANM